MMFQASIPGSYTLSDVPYQLPAAGRTGASGRRSERGGIIQMSWMVRPSSTQPLAASGVLCAILGVGHDGHIPTVNQPAVKRHLVSPIRRWTVGMKRVDERR